MHKAGLLAIALQVFACVSPRVAADGETSTTETPTADGDQTGETGGTWPEDLPPEEVVAVDCPGDSCLTVQPGTVFCAVDPSQFVDGDLFARKSTLSVAAGGHVLDQGIADLRESLVFEVASRTGRSTLTFDADADLQVSEDVSPMPTTIDEMARVAVVGSAIGPDGFAARMTLVTSRWPHPVFHLGDPENDFWFYWVRRNVQLDLSSATPVFPTLAEGGVLYRPCRLRDQPDEVFTFLFADGTQVEAVVRTAHGHQWFGYYLGRLLHVEGERAGVPFEERDYDDLVFIGSDDRGNGNKQAPGLAVRLDEEEGSCGFVFLPDELSDVRYAAYVLNCDLTRGAELELVSAVVPDGFLF